MSVYVVISESGFYDVDDCTSVLGVYADFKAALYKCWADLVTNSLVDTNKIEEYKVDTNCIGYWFNCNEDIDMEPGSYWRHTYVKEMEVVK